MKKTGSKWDSSSDDEVKAVSTANKAAKKKAKNENLGLPAPLAAVTQAASVLVPTTTTAGYSVRIAGSSVGNTDFNTVALTAHSEQLSGEQNLSGNKNASQQPTLAPTSSHGQSLISAVSESSQRVHNPLFHGCRSIDEYERVSYISQGTYGVVFRARCKSTNTIYAVKQVKLGPESNKVGFPVSALRETNILLCLAHDNIIKVREMVVGSSTDKVFMVMDYYDNDLRYCLDQSKHAFSTAEVKQLMVQLLKAVEHMHSHWFIHRDLKTTNLLYSNRGDLVVCDFGMARKYDSPIKPYTKEVVTLWYRPPELLLGSTTYTTALDMWSVACIFGEMLSGTPLLPGQGEVDQIARIFKLVGAPSEERWPGYSKLPHAAQVSTRMPPRGKLRETFPSTSFSGSVFLNDTGFDLLSRLLHMDPTQRMTAASAMEHPWIVSELPRPTRKDLMPTFRSRHDIEQQQSSKEPAREATDS